MKKTYLSILLSTLFINYSYAQTATDITESAVEIAESAVDSTMETADALLDNNHQEAKDEAMQNSSYMSSSSHSNSTNNHSLENTIDIVEGTDYEVLETPIATSSGEKIEVLEFFWYGCPHCFSLEDDVTNWKKNNLPAQANFIAAPVPTNAMWEQHARLYYTLAALNKDEELHDVVFNTIHVQKNKLQNKRAILDFLEENGIDKDVAEETFDSFAVNTQINNTINKFKESKLTGVPNIVVNGKYVTNPGLAGSQQRTMDVVNALVKKSLEE